MSSSINFPAVFILSFFMIFRGQSDEYVPTTSDPAVVYREACVRCHGADGKGQGPLYPDLLEAYMEKEAVLNIVRNGEMFMPAFPNIPDSTLNRLADFMSNKEFLK